VVKYSPRSARALGFLKRFYNDVDIYIEDVSGHNMALLVLRAILGNKVRLTSISQLGGKKEIIKACKLDQIDDGRKKLYIIDGDYDCLTGARKPGLRYLYRLRCYCIENLLISNEAVLAIAVETLTNVSPDKIEPILDHETWMHNTYSSLLPLFIIYAVAVMLSPEIATTGFNVFKLCIQSKDGPILAESKIRSRMRSVIREVLKHAKLDTVRKLRQEVQTRAKQYREGDVLSGKDYLLPLLFARLRAVIKFHGSMEEFKVRLAARYDVACEPFLARRLRSVAQL
jgi:hypothetical protein